MSGKPKQKEENRMDKHVEIMIKDDGHDDFDLVIQFPLKGSRGNPIHANVYGFGYVGDEESEARFIAFAEEVADFFKSASIKIKRPVFEYFNTFGEKADEG